MSGIVKTILLGKVKEGGGAGRERRQTEEGMGRQYQNRELTWMTLARTPKASKNYQVERDGKLLCGAPVTLQDYGSRPAQLPLFCTKYFFIFR